MKAIKRFFAALPAYVLWLLFSALFWAWIFGFVTDTRPEKKLTLFVDCAVCRDTELAVELEKQLPEGIKMVKVHPFSYAVFGERELLGADLYIVPASRAGDYADSFLPLNRALSAKADGLWSRDGTAYGLRLYDAAAGEGAATDYIGYTAEGEEDYYLFFGVRSLHCAALSGAGDDSALALAETLLSMKEGGEKP